MLEFNFGLLVVLLSWMWTMEVRLDTEEIIEDDCVDRGALWTLTMCAMEPSIW